MEIPEDLAWMKDLSKEDIVVLCCDNIISKVAGKVFEEDGLFKISVIKENSIENVEISRISLPEPIYDAIDIAPYEFSFICRIKQGELFLNEVVARKWSEDKQSIVIMFDSHNFLNLPIKEKASKFFIKHLNMSPSHNKSDFLLSVK